jgi:probable phosphoglycerate mutase
VRHLVIEADGGSRGNPGPAAYGAVVLDGRTGEILVELADFLGIQTNNVAEYEGVTAGLAAAMEIDPQAQVEARLDSKLVVEQLSGGWAIKNAKLRELALRAKALAPPDRVRFTWVPRAQNKRADALANQSLDAAAAGRPARIERWNRGAGDPDIYVDVADHLGASAQSAPIGPAGASSTKIVGWSRADLGAPTTLLMVRHGVTQQSIEHRFSGINGFDPPLIELGRRQAEAAAEELARRGGADILVCSPLQRTRQTAAIIAERLGMGEPMIVGGIAEADFGEWDSLNFAEVKARWPDELAAWLASTEVAPPGGESFAQVRRRVDAARADLVAQFPRKRVLAVSHVTPIKVMVQLVLEAPASSAYRFELAPCSLTTLAWWADGISTIFGMGESGHLHGVMHDTA